MKTVSLRVHFILSFYASSRQYPNQHFWVFTVLTLLVPNIKNCPCTKLIGHYSLKKYRGLDVGTRLFLTSTLLGEATEAVNMPDGEGLPPKRGQSVTNSLYCVIDMKDLRCQRQTKS